MQWWPGGLGKVSTHAVAYARHITDGQDHGVHGNYRSLLNWSIEIHMQNITYLSKNTIWTFY